MKAVYLKFFFDDKDQSQEQSNLPLPAHKDQDSEAEFFEDLMKDDLIQQNNKESEIYKVEVELEREIGKLADILSKPKFIKEIKNKKFWAEYIDVMPRLAALGSF